MLRLFVSNPYILCCFLKVKSAASVSSSNQLHIPAENLMTGKAYVSLCWLILWADFSAPVFIFGDIGLLLFSPSLLHLDCGFLQPQQIKNRQIFYLRPSSFSVFFSSCLWWLTSGEKFGLYWARSLRSVVSSSRAAHQQDLNCTTNFTSHSLICHWDFFCYYFD